MAKLFCAIFLFASSAVLTANAGHLRVQPQSFPEPSSDVTVFKNEIAHNPTVSIVPPGNAPAYIVSPLRVNLPFDPLVFPSIAQVPSNAIVKSPPVSHLIIMCRDLLNHFA